MEELLEYTVWWNGPEFLRGGPSEWPAGKAPTLSDQARKEFKKEKGRMNEGPELLEVNLCNNGADAYDVSGSRCGEERIAECVPWNETFRLHPGNFESFDMCVRVATRIVDWVRKFRARKREGRGIDRGSPVLEKK